MNTITKILTKLDELKSIESFSKNYYVPKLWLNDFESGSANVNPYEFFIERINKVISLSKNLKQEEDTNWSDQAIVYNLFVRLATSFDHDNDGRIGFPIGTNCMRETGTFLKSIAILPYIHSLGVNTIYLLPITSIGIDGRKGNLGSPYAIKNPYKLDENLSEPMLTDISIEEQFKAFVEAAHLLGIKVVCEFVFRTGSIDSDLAVEHPDWFYWIDSSIEDRPHNSIDESLYGPPIFSQNELSKIKKKIESSDFNNLPVPHREHTGMFTKVPVKPEKKENQILGKIDKLKYARIPGAFADWPPNDSQPVWSDVTYLRLYDSEEFNYIAYNTVRMYDNKLKSQRNVKHDLWESICNIIPFYQDKFDIDGVMIDMGHALPSELRYEIIERARKNKENFVFWEENFVLSEVSVNEGYNASLGYLPFDQIDGWKMRNLIGRFARKDFPINFFGTPETHNTPRAASRIGNSEFSKYSYTLNRFLPNITFIHNGFELGENFPVNTGLGFSESDYQKFPPHKLPLFSESALTWGNSLDVISHIHKINDIYKKLISEKNCLKSTNIHLIETYHNDIIAFVRREKASKKEILVIGNSNHYDEIFFDLDLLDYAIGFQDEITGKYYSAENGVIKLVLEPHQTMVGEVLLG